MLAKDSLRQPRGLYLLFFTEMWERFGFYTLQTIIILYMSKSLLYGDDHSYAVYAAFSGLLYLMPVLGGYLADRYFGFQYAIIIGGIIFILSYILTALSGSHAFFLGLSTTIKNGLKNWVFSVESDIPQKDLTIFLSANSINDVKV